MPVVCALAMAANVSSVTFSMLTGASFWACESPGHLLVRGSKWLEGWRLLPPLVNLLEPGDRRRLHLLGRLVLLGRSAGVERLLQLSGLGDVDRDSAPILAAQVVRGRYGSAGEHLRLGWLLLQHPDLALERLDRLRHRSQVSRLLGDDLLLRGAVRGELRVDHVRDTALENIREGVAAVGRVVGVGLLGDAVGYGVGGDADLARRRGLQFGGLGGGVGGHLARAVA